MKAPFLSDRGLSWLILVVFFIAAPVFSQEPGDGAGSSELTGTWHVKMALPTGEKPAEAEAKLYILKVEGTDKASIRNPDQGELKVTDVLVQGDALQVYFDYSPVKGEPGNSVELKGALDEKGNLSGTWQFLVTGQSLSLIHI